MTIALCVLETLLNLEAITKFDPEHRFHLNRLSRGIGGVVSGSLRIDFVRHRSKLGI